MSDHARSIDNASQLQPCFVHEVVFRKISKCNLALVIWRSTRLNKFCVVTCYKMFNRPWINFRAPFVWKQSNRRNKRCLSIYDDTAIYSMWISAKRFLFSVTEKWRQRKWTNFRRLKNHCVDMWNVRITVPCRTQILCNNQWLDVPKRVFVLFFCAGRLE